MALEDRIDFALRPTVDVPAIDVANRVQLPRMAGAPEGDRGSLIEYPSYSKRQDRFAEALVSECFEFMDRSQILRRRGAWNFGSTLRRSSPVKTVSAVIRPLRRPRHRAP